MVTGLSIIGTFNGYPLKRFVVRGAITGLVSNTTRTVAELPSDLVVENVIDYRWHFINVGNSLLSNYSLLNGSNEYLVSYIQGNHVYVITGQADNYNGRNITIIVDYFVT